MSVPLKLPQFFDVAPNSVITYFTYISIPRSVIIKLPGKNYETPRIQNYPFKVAFKRKRLYVFVFDLRKPCSDIVRGGVAGVAGGSGTEEEWN